MAESVYTELCDQIRSIVSSVEFFALSCNKTTNCDNRSWLSVFIYFCEDWLWVPYLISLEKVTKSPTADHLCSKIVEAVAVGGM
jgi:hypothetical protein